MEYAYAIDSLHYVLSLLLIAAGALRVTSWLGKVAIAIGAALLAMTPDKPRHLWRGYPIMWGFSDTFINPDFVSVLCSGWCPREGVISLRQMSRWGDTPLFPPPRGEAINPQRGGQRPRPQQ
jgi:hypothetical protein